MNKTATTLLAKIQSGDCAVGIIGLGYVGLPLALAFAEAGSQVVGYDNDADKVDKINNGDNYIAYLDSDNLRRQVAAGRLSASAEISSLAAVDAIFICVPTPLDSTGEPDLSYVEGTGTVLSKVLRTGQLIVLESTTYPGTTEEVLRPLLEQSDLVCGEEFFLAYSPEREDPANADFTTRTLPRVVGGTNPAATELAQALLGRIVDRVFPVSSTRVAEASKLTENIFRAVNIALVNELKMTYEAMGIDVWEVLDAAETKPFGFMRFNPGPGWGGHCIPIDPFYLAWKARQFGVSSRFVELAGEINVEMPEYVVGKIENSLAELDQPLEGSRVLVLGIAYKPDVADPRESPAFEVITLLLKKGALVSYYDPLIEEIPKMRSWPNLPALRSVELTPREIASYEAVVVVTDHSSVDYDLVVENAKLLVDTRHAIDRGKSGIVRA